MNINDFDRRHAPELVKREENASFLKSIELSERKILDEARDYGRIWAEKYISKYKSGEKRVIILVPAAVSSNGKKCIKAFNAALIETANSELIKEGLVVDEEEYGNGIFTLKNI